MEVPVFDANIVGIVPIRTIVDVVFTAVIIAVDVAMIVAVSTIGCFCYAGSVCTVPYMGCSC